MPDTYTSQFSGEEIDSALRAAQIISGASTPAELRKKLEIRGDTIPVSAEDSTLISGALKYRVNPNLLDNWYFGRPVNQRDGYIPKDIFVKVYNDVTCTDYAGPVNYYPPLIKESNGNFKYNIGSNVFYIKAEDTVSGYANDGYTVDRWKLLIDATKLLIKTGYISLTAVTSDYVGVMQLFEAEPLLGQTVTFSALCRYTGSGGNILPYITAYCGDNVYDGWSQINSTDWMLASFTHTFPETKPNDNRFGFDIVTMKSFGVDIKAAKLELGSTQTLAHKENGAWVLNEIPDFGEQLRRCQRYCRPIPHKLDVCVVGGTYYAYTEESFEEMRVAPVSLTNLVGKNVLNMTDNVCASITNVYNFNKYGGCCFALSQNPNTDIVFLDSMNYLISADL